MSFGQWASDHLGVPLEEQFNFNPLTYFLYSGIDGAWFDPEDMSTMFLDAAGTTPVTALGQPVGLWLDKSQGMELGPELIAAPYSGNVSGMWTFDAVSVNRNSAGGGYCKLTLAEAIKLNTKYKVTFTLANKTGDDLIVRVGNDIGIYTRFSSNGPCSTIIESAGTSPVIIFAGYTGTTGTATITNISIREIKGNHATQSVTASRPTLSARYNWLLNSATLSTQSVPTYAVQYMLSFTGTGSVTLSGSATGTLTGTGANNRVSLPFAATAGTLTLTVSGAVTLAMLAFGTLTTYQAITTAISYDSVGWPRYLSSDGVDDFYNLPFMNLYGNGACTLVAACDAVSQATDTYIISERSTTDVDPKYFPSRQLASGGNMNSYIASNEGTVRLDTTGSAFSGAKLAAIRSVVDSGSNIKLFKDGAVVADDNYTRAGTLTLNNTTIGASVSTTTSNYANMRLYGLIVTKSALSDTDRRRCEQFLSRKLSKLGVTLS